MAITLGSKVRDSITGFAGIAVGRIEWLYGCSRIGIEPQELREGKPIEHQFFDEQRVELVQEQPPPVSTQSTARIGGPHREPKRPSGSP